MHPIPLLQDPPFVLLLVLLGTALGYRLLALLRVPIASATRLERGVLCASLGLGLLQYLAFGLGMAHRLYPPAVGICLFLVSALLLPDMLRILSGIFHAERDFRRIMPAMWRASRPTAAALLVGVTLLLGITFLLALCPCTDPDGLGYHLRAPKMWLQSGFLDFLPTLTHTNSPMGVEMLYALPLAVWSDTAAKLIHYAFGVLTLLAIIACGRQLGNTSVGLWAAGAFALGVPGGTVLSLYSSAYVDLAVALEVVCAMLAWIWWSKTRARGWLICAGLCAGFAFSFKLTGVLIVFTLGALTLWETRRPHILSPAAGKKTGEEGQDAAGNREYPAKPDEGGWQSALLLVGVGLLPGLPWLLRAALVAGNPFYPFLPQWFPTRDWSVEQGRVFETFMRYYNWSRTHTGWSLGFRKRLLAGAIVAYGSWFLIMGRRWRAAHDTIGVQLLFLAALPTLLSLLNTGLYLRFLVPLLPVYTILLFWRLSQAGESGRRFRMAALCWFLLNGLLFLRSTAASLPEAGRVAIGRVSRDAYLAHQLPILPLWKYANSRLPPDAHIMVVRLGCYYFDATCYNLNAYYEQRIRLDTWAHFMADTRREHIGYLIIAPARENQAVYGPDTLPARNENVFPQRLARLYGQPLAAASDLCLYRLNLPSAPPNSQAW